MFRTTEITFHVVATCWSILKFMEIYQDSHIFFFFWSALMFVDTLTAMAAVAVMNPCLSSMFKVDNNPVVKLIYANHSEISFWVSVLITSTSSLRFVSSYLTGVPLDNIDCVMIVAGTIVKFFI